MPQRFILEAVLAKHTQTERVLSEIQFFGLKACVNFMRTGWTVESSEINGI